MTVTMTAPLVCPACGSEDYGTNGCGDCLAPDPDFLNDAHYPERFDWRGHVYATHGKQETPEYVEPFDVQADWEERA